MSSELSYLSPPPSGLTTTFNRRLAVFFAEQSDRNSEMAARLRVRHQDEIRTKIQTTQLINRLTGCALGELDLSPTQLRSIEILLKKSLPDLMAVSIEGPGEDGEFPVTFTWANQPAS